ncbi:MAG: Gfo/Idh/MocA family oxidoreductase [Ardenticatenaceae bacterium]|nr:Gfo/Idh/MocA family oxidoreductase [Ardenticatenaceae bacterium]MCB9445902.1 Gfo/Idh/MocA family oxidoreductase [Ardenticatenaceae bacterium]
MNENHDLPYQPRFPTDYRPGIGIIGSGNIVRSAHLPAYQKHGLNLVGVYDPFPEATQGVQEQFGIQHIYGSLEALLADPAVEIVDIATFPEQRIPIMRQALAAGKHILAQKPLALDMEQAREIVAEAERSGLKVAVNQNGRWSPPWRIATLLIQDGAIGEVMAVTHLFDVNFGWVPGTRFDVIPHWVIYDYSIHWFDITRCWLAGKTIETVSAKEYKTSNQPDKSEAAWGMWSEIHCLDGANAILRCVGGSHSRQNGHYFWIHGAKGTIRGCVLPDRFVELDSEKAQTRFDFQGEWFPDGFAGTMGELMWAIRENRQPYNSARHHLASLALTLAACQSAGNNGQPVGFNEVI